MLCFVYKWLISRALDSGKKLPNLAARHLNRCQECRHFARLSESLASKLTLAGAVFRQGNHHVLNEKIISALVTQPIPRSTPKGRFLPIPAFAAALVTLAAVVGIILLQVIPLPAPGPDKSLLNDLPRIAATKPPLQEIVGLIESPMETEMLGLEKSMKSALEHLLSCLNPTIGTQ